MTSFVTSRLKNLMSCACSTVELGQLLSCLGVPSAQRCLHHRAMRDDRDGYEGWLWNAMDGVFKPIWKKKAMRFLVERLCSRRFAGIQKRLGTTPTPAIRKPTTELQVRRVYSQTNANETSEILLSDLEPIPDHSSF